MQISRKLCIFQYSKHVVYTYMSVYWQNYLICMQCMHRQQLCQCVDWIMHVIACEHVIVWAELCMSLCVCISVCGLNYACTIVNCTCIHVCHVIVSLELCCKKNIRSSLVDKPETSVCSEFFCLVGPYFYFWFLVFIIMKQEINDIIWKNSNIWVNRIRVYYYF